MFQATTGDGPHISSWLFITPNYTCVKYQENLTNLQNLSKLYKFPYLKVQKSFMQIKFRLHLQME